MTEHINIQFIYDFYTFLTLLYSLFQPKKW